MHGSDLLEAPIYDLDIGHLPPQLILVNGAPATVTFSAAEKSLAQRLA